MKFKRLSALLTLLLALSTFFSSFAFAQENNKKNLVALGDSITFGYKLETNQSQASPNAFPNLIDNGGFNVTNLGVPGWTSSQLLAALNTDQFSNAVKAANVITLDIGSNDLLQAADLSGIISSHKPVDPKVLEPKVQAAAAQFGANLRDILKKIKTDNPTAPIILYNLYNPFGESTDPFFAYLHTVGEGIVTGVDSNVIAPLADEPGVYLADAYSKYNGHQTEYITQAVDLIHPNLEGHKALAALADEILARLEPLIIDLTPSTTEQTKDPVTITVSTNAKETAQIKWLPGEKTAEDFNDAGKAITDNQFQVTENGKYTVYVMDNRECEAVKTIEITNITKDNGNPNPGDNGNHNPAPTPTPTPTPTISSGTGHVLPNTATPMFNYVAIGLVFVLAGLFSMKLQQFRRRENQ